MGNLFYFFRRHHKGHGMLSLAISLVNLQKFGCVPASILKVPYFTRILPSKANRPLAASEISEVEKIGIDSFFKDRAEENFSKTKLLLPTSALCTTTGKKVEDALQQCSLKLEEHK